MEVHGMSHGAVRQVSHMHFNSIAHTHAVEGPRHLAIECPIGEGCSVCELAFDFHGFQVNAHRCRFAITDGSRHFSWVAYNIRACGGGIIDNDWSAHRHMLACWCGHRHVTAGCAAGHFELAYHASLAVSGDDTVIGE